MRMQDRTVCDVLVLQFKIVQYVMQPTKCIESTKITKRRGALGQVMRITVHQNNRRFEQINCSSRAKYTLDNMYKHVRALKSAMALHHRTAAM